MSTEYMKKLGRARASLGLLYFENIGLAIIMCFAITFLTLSVLTLSVCFYMYNVFAFNILFS